MGQLIATIVILFYIGFAHTRASDLRVVQPAVNTDATFHDVSWEDRSFQPSPYYGVRVTYTFSPSTSAGFTLDYTHYKIFARTDRMVRMDGVWKGLPIHREVLMRDYVRDFSITHGLNMLSLNAVGGSNLYLGAGLSYYVVHGENTVAGESNAARYQGSGFGYQALGGLRTHRGGSGLFTELKLNSGNATVDTAEHGHAQTKFHTLQVLFGPDHG